MVFPARASFPSHLKTLHKPSLRHAPSQELTGAASSSASVSTISLLEQTKQIHGLLVKTRFQATDAIPFSSPQARLSYLVASYIKSDAPLAALSLYAHVRRVAGGREGGCPELDVFTVPSLLKACALLSDAGAGMEIHGYAIKSGLSWDVFVHNSLMQLYSACEFLESAVKMFDEIPVRDVVSWSTMLQCFTQRKLFKEGVELAREMLYSGMKPSEVTIINMLNLFADIGDLHKGWPVHAYLVKITMDQLPPSVNATTALIDMYVKCGNAAAARRVFNRMEERSTASWAAMISGCIRCKDLEAATKLFAEMQDSKVLPNEITMLSLVIECGLSRALALGKWIHGYILRNGFPMSVVLGTALVDMYCKCRDIRSARTMFDNMGKKDIMSWTAMISGYSHSGHVNETFDLFQQMKDANMIPNEVTMVNLLTLCSESGALDRGRWVHACIDKQGIKLDVVLATALIDMYAKCGDIDGAYTVFNRTIHRDVCMWNAMVNGLAMNGNGDEAIKLYSQMKKGTIKPNDVTFIGVLRACSHSGLVAEGKKYFNQMARDYGLVQKVEHYGCMVDLLGRSGNVDEAYEMILKMPLAPNIIIWGALLAACKVHKNPKLGEAAAKELLKLEPHSTGYNIVLSNIYAIDRRWNKVAEVRKSMRDTGVEKTPGISAIEVNGVVHEFVMGDISHPKIDQIQAMVSEMQSKLKRAGHVVDTSGVFLNIDEEEKETMLNLHSEKLAMAFGLISTGHHTPIRVVKNLRVCDDCHAATKLLSKIYGRMIIVRDRNRFHRFSEGFCSCNDYW